MKKYYIKSNEATDKLIDLDTFYGDVQDSLWKYFDGYDGDETLLEDQYNTTENSDPFDEDSYYEWYFTFADGFEGRSIWYYASDIENIKKYSWDEAVKRTVSDIIGNMDEAY